MGRVIKGWLAVVVLLGTVVYATAEDLTVTTYYPSPRGVYQDLQATASFTYTDGNEGVGKILVSNAAGNARWTDATDPTVPLVPDGMVAIFPGGCPGGWSPFGDADGVYLRGGGGPGYGGFATHKHVMLSAKLAHVHPSDPPPYAATGVANNGPPAVHQHDVNIDHSHTFSGLTGDPSGTNRMGDCDNDACSNPSPDHAHGYAGTTSTNGGDKTTSGGQGGHFHLVDVNVDLPTWDVGLPVWTLTDPETEEQPNLPEYYTARLCIKN